MNNEIINNELENEAIDTVEVEIYDEPIEESKGAPWGLILGLATAIGGGIALIKNRHKIKEKIDQARIKKLEKRGYLVVPQRKDEEPETVEDGCYEVVAEED